MLYAITAARDILPADSGEFQLIAAGWGIGHPPGYPLYTIAGALWVRGMALWPWGNSAFHLNLFSAALAATTLVLIYETVRMWATHGGMKARAARIGGLTAVLALGCATTFWAQATTANIRMPTMLFTAWGFWALTQHAIRSPYLKSKVPNLTSSLFPLALAVGLGVGHHPSLVFVVVGWALYVLLREPRLVIQPRRWWLAAVVAALAWGVPQLYLPLRSLMPNVALNPGNLATWSSFWDHVLARGFGGDMFAFATVADLTQRLPLLPTLFRLQFPPLLLCAIATSWVWLLGTHPRWAIAFGMSWGLHTFVTLTYRAPQTVEYLMPAYIPMALVLGMGVGRMANGRSRGSAFGWVRPCILHLATYILVLFLLFRISATAADFAYLANDTAIRGRMLPVLEAAPPGARVWADWRWATPLWVLQHEGIRPDVDVVYEHPDSPYFSQAWQAGAETAGGPAILTTHYFADWAGWTFAPVGGGYQAFPRPLMALPTSLNFIPMEADLGTLRLLGYRWTDLQTDHFSEGELAGDARPGRQVELHLAWQAMGPQTPPPSFTARIWDAEGALLAATDQFLGGDSTAGEIRFTQLTLQLPIDRCTHALYPTVGVYTVQEGSFQDLGSVSLPAGSMDCLAPRLPTQRYWPGVVWGKGPFLRGVDYDVNGDLVTAYLHWCGPGAALHIAVGASQAAVAPLALGRCQTVRVTVPSGPRPHLTLTRNDGAVARLFSLPLPRPRSNERYVPYGDAVVLVKSVVAQRGGQHVVDLEWRTTRPLLADYGVSVRLLDANRALLVPAHDSQPGLGALPTLKWGVRGAYLLDPHPFTDLGAMPSAVELAVYERFRMTPLLSPQGQTLVFQHP